MFILKELNAAECEGLASETRRSHSFSTLHSMMYIEVVGGNLESFVTTGAMDLKECINSTPSSLYLTDLCFVICHYGSQFDRV